MIPLVNAGGISNHVMFSDVDVSATPPTAVGLVVGAAITNKKII